MLLFHEGWIMIEFLVVIGVGLFGFVSALVIPWVNRNDINALHKETRQLREAMRLLIEILDKENIPIPDRLRPKASVKTTIHHIQPSSSMKTTSSSSKPKFNFEKQFGANLPVWIGGFAIALAGFYLVKYSIENELVSPTVRVILGTLLGGALLYSANWIRSKPAFANGVRIAQSLSGSGIAVLYVSVFAASTLYQIIPDLMGFIGMAIVTAIAVILSLRHGPPIALMGLLGGFLTPMLIGSSNPSLPSLLIYLYVVFSGLMIVIKHKHWWVLSIPTLLATFLWVGFCLMKSFTPTDSLSLGLFLMAISATIFVSSRQSYEKHTKGVADLLKPPSLLNIIGLGGSLIYMGIIGAKVGFGIMEWSLFGLLGLGGIALAFFNEKLYVFVPWTSMAINAIMFLSWHPTNLDIFAFMLVGFAILYIAAGYFLMWSSQIPTIWAGLASATSIGFYLLGYYKLQGSDLVNTMPLFWGFAALTLAGAATYVLHEARPYYANHPHKDYLMAIFAATATAFISIALTVELEKEFLSVAFAIQMFAVSWVNKRIPIKALPPICIALATVFGFLLIPQIMLLIQLTIYSLFESMLMLQKTVPLIEEPLFQLGVPALMFIGTSYFLRLEKDGKHVQCLEVVAVALIAVMGYYLTRKAFHIDENVLFIKANFLERGVVTNILFAYGLACLYVGRYFHRIALSWSGIVLCAIAFFRILYFDLFLYNPLWSHEKVMGWPLLNTLLLPFGLPLLWSWLGATELCHLKKDKWAQYVRGFMLILIFMLISYNVRFIFHGELLHKGIVTNAEIYSYSVAWLLLGIGLLFGGVIHRDKMLRYASLGIMILTIGKVFLYDASELEGLYRVFSFFGLGLSLLTLSWFYTRFVFGKKG